MRTVVTGGLGGVSGAIVTRLIELGHEVTLTDIRPPADAHAMAVLTPALAGLPYRQADLRDAGAAAWAVSGHQAVVHTAAIPDPTQNSPHDVYATNTLATFNTVEGARLTAADRLVYISSETVLGYHYAARPVLPRHLPLDETSPTLPQDPYGLSKLVGEHIVAAAVAAGDPDTGLRAVSLRPSWVQYPTTYQRDLGSLVADPDATSPNLFCYTDGEDLADLVALALEAWLPGHQVFFAVNPDTVGDRDPAAEIRRRAGHDVQLRHGWSPRAAAIDSGLAHRVLGWVPRRSWRHYIAGSDAARQGVLAPMP